MQQHTSKFLTYIFAKLLLAYFPSLSVKTVGLWDHHAVGVCLLLSVFELVEWFL
jgi:hypothetical protein